MAIFTDTFCASMRMPGNGCTRTTLRHLTITIVRVRVAGRCRPRRATMGVSARFLESLARVAATALRSQWSYSRMAENYAAKMPLSSFVA